MPEPKTKKKKTDYIALASPFMQVRNMNVAGARALLDLKFKEIYELRGRAPEALFEEYKKLKLKADPELLKYFTLAIEHAENDE